jgi:hypothetical protein
MQKVSFFEGRFVRLGGGHAVAEVVDGVVYLAMSLRNVGNGLAVLDRWDFVPDRNIDDVAVGDLDRFRRLTRDLYVPAGEQGFWQGALREPDDPLRHAAIAAISAHRWMTVDILYGDHEGGQRTVSRFSFLPVGDEDLWLAVVTRHWNIDRPDPR